MAVIAPTFSKNVGTADGSVVQATWILTTADFTGEGIEFAEWADHTWVLTGTWGAATAKIQGSADNTTWVTAAGLSSAAGGAEFTAAADKLGTLIERPRYLRPILTAVGVGATVTVTALLRRASSMRA